MFGKIRKSKFNTGMLKFIDGEFTEIQKAFADYFKKETVSFTITTPKKRFVIEE